MAKLEGVPRLDPFFALPHCVFIFWPVIVTLNAVSVCFHVVTGLFLQPIL